mgnify:CR=1 FL=1
MPDRDGPYPAAVKEEIAREIAQVHLESYGEPVQNVAVEIGERFIGLIMDIVLSPVEQLLVGGGSREKVRVGREAYQEVIEPVFRAIVERASGRRVDGFASRTVIEDEAPSWSTEVFRMAPSA